ncbi:hypothetical protein ACVWWO_003658 [Bradyrhizobium sp. F1.13.1]
MSRKALNSLLAARNTAQHGLSSRTSGITSQAVDVRREWMAIPAGLTPTYDTSILIAPTRHFCAMRHLPDCSHPNPETAGRGRFSPKSRFALRPQARHQWRRPFHAAPEIRTTDSLCEPAGLPAAVLAPLRDARDALTGCAHGANHGHLRAPVRRLCRRAAPPAIAGPGAAAPRSPKVPDVR